MTLKYLVALILLFAPFQSHGAVVLTIDISNPSAVVITAIPNPSLIDKSLAVNYSGGISFLNFFTANESIVSSPLAITGNWKANGTSASYTEMVTFVYEHADPVPGVDLSIYNLAAGYSEMQSFSTSLFAFTGSSIVNFTGLTHLPAIGTTGNVMLGYQSDQGGSIGEWKVIPEPSAVLLGALGTIGALGMLRRR